MSLTSSPAQQSALATLPVAETFYSIQGEGKLTGVPSFFIRVSGCNLRCTWCDTPYTSWSPEGTQRTIDSLLAEAAATPARHAIVTGGEPMIFPNIEPLCRRLREAGLHVTIETAGTVARDVPCDLMSISPKLSNSTPAEGDARDPGGVWRNRHEDRRIDTAALQSLIDGHPDRQLKFVVQQPADLEEITALLNRLRNWRDEDVMLMPEGVSPPDANRRAWLVEECLRRNWRYCPRLHIEIFGNKRGT